MTYSNFSISTGKPAETLVGHEQTRLNVLAIRKNKNTEQISAPYFYLKNIQPSTLSPSTIKAFSAISASGESL